MGVLGELLPGRARADARRDGRHRRAAGDLQAARRPTAEAGLQLHEPRPLAPRPRERVIPDRVDPRAATGRLVLADVYDGRNMAGVKRGEIKKLLVLETLPMPIHYTGGMEPLSYGGTFTLERILGTVPVEADGSAYFELPALRSFFFVALDENDLSVKRMQSFLTVQPGETTSCVGCHEQRTQTPRPAAMQLAALRRPPSRIEPIADVPDVFDFPRDIQPILDALCVSCHGYEKTAAGGPRAGRLILTGDRGPIYSHSYYMLTIARLFSDGRNEPRSNYAPRTLGSSASRLLTLLDGTHYGVQATPHQKKLLRLWIESGAAYPGTYAALGCGMIGDYAENQQINTGEDWPATRAAAEVIEKRCAACHAEPGAAPAAQPGRRARRLLLAAQPRRPAPAHQPPHRLQPLPPREVAPPARAAGRVRRRLGPLPRPEDPRARDGLRRHSRSRLPGPAGPVRRRQGRSGPGHPALRHARLPPPRRLGPRNEALRHPARGLGSRRPDRLLRRGTPVLGVTLVQANRLLPLSPNSKPT